jgi:beta-mannanase
MEPSRSPTEIATIPQDILDKVAQACKRINTHYGTPILFRYAHEMNGDWTNYGMQPTAYTIGFRRMAKAIHAVTNITAMVWAPNVGIQYPFGKTNQKSNGLPHLEPGSPDFLLLDTNKNGVLDTQDDPYTPFYPGDEFVDWFGLSIYWYPDAETGFNNLPPSRYFLDHLTGVGESVKRYNPKVNGLSNR